jgi:hypothetical protein
MYDQTRACQALLSSVIALAVNDATAAPVKNKDSKFPMTVEAFTAMRFLFDETQSGLAEYATWLDIDPGHFRTKLREVMADNHPHPRAGFDAMRRRNFRQNYGLWLRIKGEPVSLEEEE